MLKYNLVSGKVVIDPLSIQIAGLMRIWEEDQSVMKEKATKLLTYVHIVSQLDQDAPYFTADPDEIQFLVKKDLYGDMNHDFGTENQAFLDECVWEYRKAYEVPEQRGIRILNEKIDQIQNKIDSTNVEIKENTVKGVITYSSNFDILNKMIQNLNKISDERDKRANVLAKGKPKASVIRGGKTMSFLEKQLKNQKYLQQQEKAPEPVDETL